MFLNDTTYSLYYSSPISSTIPPCWLPLRRNMPLKWRSILTSFIRSLVQKGKPLMKCSIFTPSELEENGAIMGHSSIYIDPSTSTGPLTGGSYSLFSHTICTVYNMHLTNLSVENGLESSYPVSTHTTSSTFPHQEASTSTRSYHRIQNTSCTFFLSSIS